MLCFQPSTSYQKAETQTSSGPTYCFAFVIKIAIFQRGTIETIGIFVDVENGLLQVLPYLFTKCHCKCCDSWQFDPSSSQPVSSDGEQCSGISCGVNCLNMPKVSHLEYYSQMVRKTEIWPCRACLWYHLGTWEGAGSSFSRPTVCLLLPIGQAIPDERRFHWWITDVSDIQSLCQVCTLKTINYYMCN